MRNLQISIVKKIYYTLVYLLLLFFIIVFSSNDYKNFGIGSLVALVLSVLYLKLSTRIKFLSIPCVFSILVWIFHFGYFPLYVFNLEENIFVNDLLKYSFLEAKDGYIICLIFYFSLNIGISLTAKQQFVSKKKKIFSDSFSKKLFSLWAILTIPYLIYTFYLLKLDGYTMVRENTVGGILSYVFLLYYVLSILVFYDTLTKRKFFWSFNIIVIYGLQIFTGQRFDSVCMEVVLFLILLTNIKLKKRTYFFLILIGIITMYIMSTVGKYRFDNALMFKKIFDFDNYIDFLKNNPLMTTLGDFGGTFTSVMALTNRNNNLDYLYGGTYFVSLFRIIPSMHRIFPEKFSYFVLILPIENQGSLGGSLIGEAYANIGYFGFIIMLIYGIMIGKLYSYSEKIKSNDLLMYCWSYILFLEMLNLVRGYNHNIVFLPFWTWIVFEMIKNSKIYYWRKNYDKNFICNGIVG